MAFLCGLIKSKPNVTPLEARLAIADEFGTQVHRSTMSRILKRLGVTKVHNEREVVKSVQVSHAGFELIAAIAIHLGWPKHTAQCVMEVVEKKQLDSQQNKPVDNQVLQRMDIFKTSLRNLERKALAILALPLVTLNGEVRHVNTALGNALQGFCGYNYKQATLDQFLRELKYLGISESLLGSQVPFWYEKWKNSGSKLELPFLCYYIDGNTKPVWSKYRVMQNKVTMIGRVMGCLEQVFVHDCFGHPIYFETYCGHAPMGVYTLSLMKKVEQRLKEIAQTTSVTRVLVMDGANNSVETLRALASQTSYHYITTLDDNQWSKRKVRFEKPPERYRWGKATLYSGEIELEDSKEKGYLIVVRTVRIEWDNGKRTVLLTSLPMETVGASLVVKGYFSRWPQQELSFRNMKGFSSIHRVAGYGKQLVENPTVREKQQELEQKLKVLKNQLKEPLNSLAQETETLTKLIEEERILRSISCIQDGKRIMEEIKDMEALQICTSKIEKIHKSMKAIEKKHEKDFKSLYKYEAQWMRLQGKEIVYKMDVELDQILTYFRVSLSNICAYFLKEFLQKGSMSFSTLMQSILLLDGEVFDTNKQRKVVLKRNSKDPVMMKKLEEALKKLNALSLKTLSGKHYQFFLN
jgi:hypothetical protein